MAAVPPEHTQSRFNSSINIRRQQKKLIEISIHEGARLYGNIIQSEHRDFT